MSRPVTLFTVQWPVLSDDIDDNYEDMRRRFSNQR
jgi:hypothetical protein